MLKERTRGINTSPVQIGNEFLLGAEAELIVDDG
jgi:hypothetical protein